MLTSTSNVKRHTENGVTTDFPFNFKVDSPTELEVDSIDLSGVPTRLSYPGDFTVTGLHDNDGGYITKVAGTNGLDLLIRRVTPITQTTKLRGQTELDPVVLEDALDKLAKVDQQNAEELTRTFRSSVEGIDTELPTPEAGYALGWNATGTGLVNVPNTGADQSADLANNTSAVKGAGLLGFSNLLSYAVGTVGAFLVGLAGASGAAQLGYTQAGVGATLRTIQDALRVRVCVFDFMTAAEIADVKAYAYTLDVSAAVQKAIDAAAGKEILFPAGGYKIGTKVNYFNTTGVAQPRGLKILGEGAWNTIFKNEVANDPLFDVNTGVGATAGGYFFSYGGYISGVTILGHSSVANSDAIRVRSCWKFRIENVDIADCTRYGLHVDNDTGINPDYTASASMVMNNVRITGCKKGIYQPYGNGWPYACLINCYITNNTDIGVEFNSSLFHWIQGACAYNGSAYSGDGTPSLNYGGIIIRSSDHYVAKGIVIDGIEFDNNIPQQVWALNAKSPIVKSSSIVTRITTGYANKYSLVFGMDTADSFCEAFTVENNNFQTPDTFAATGLTHTFVLTKPYTKGGWVGNNGYSIAGGTIGTELFFVEENTRIGSLALSRNRLKFIAQSGESTRAAYKVIFDGAIPISRLPMPDDTAISMKPLSLNGALFITFNGAAAYTAIIGYEITGGKTFIMTSGSTGIDIKASSTVLTGTTGTDGKLTVSTDATSGKIYIENRQGGSLAITVQIMDGYGSWL